MTSTPHTRVALLGCGGIQAKHARTFLARPDAQIAALCDVSDAAIESLIERLNAPEALKGVPRFTDPEAMYDAVELEAVSIATPHTLHFEQAMAALGRGLHVLLEKPMVTQADHARALAAEVERRGKVLIVAYNTPCSTELAYIRQLIRSGELGRLELISGHLSQNWMRATAGSWRQKPELSGGGQAYDSGAHPLASMCWAVESPVQEVYALVDNLGTPVDINSAFTIRFANGAFAALAISGNCPTNGAHMAMMFTDGKIEFDPWTASQVKVWKGKEPIDPLPITGQKVTPAINFLDAIAGKDQPRSTAATGIILSELMDLIYESARTGQPAKPAEAQRLAAGGASAG